jgi:hypothetical protein
MPQRLQYRVWQLSGKRHTWSRTGGGGGFAASINTFFQSFNKNQKMTSILSLTPEILIECAPLSSRAMLLRCTCVSLKDSVQQIPEIDFFLSFQGSEKLNPSFLKCFSKVRLSIATKCSMDPWNASIKWIEASFQSINQLGMNQIKTICAHISDELMNSLCSSLSSMQIEPQRKFSHFVIKLTCNIKKLEQTSETLAKMLAFSETIDVEILLCSWSDNESRICGHLQWLMPMAPFVTSFNIRFVWSGFF